MAFDLALDTVFDPLLNDTFSRVRRLEARDAHGRSQVTPTQTDGLTGVVTMNEDIEDIRNEFPEVQYATRVISVVTNQNFQAAVKDAQGNSYQPDLVVWRGDNYVVLRVSPYPQFGIGWHQVVAMSIDKVDALI
jgi:hypothetical protein